MADDDKVPVPPQGDPETPPEPPADTDWKSEARKHERSSKKLFSENEQLRTQLATFEEGQKSDVERQLAAARKEATDATAAEWQAKVRDIVVENEALRQLHGRVSAPTNRVLKLLDLSDVNLDAEGRADTQAVSTAIEDLLEEWPGLADGSTAAPPPAAREDLGPKRGSTKQEISADDLYRRAFGH